jgi:SAM-dependent methyltransferase
MADEVSTQDAERFLSFERRRHDHLAASYHDHLTPVTAQVIPPIFEALRLAPGARLLDVATGPGALAAAASRRGAIAVGIDLSPRMIEIAATAFPGIEFRVAEVEHLPFADGTFDAVACNFGIGHFPRPEAAVAECVRALKSGGRLALSWWQTVDKLGMQGLFRDAIAEVGAQPPPDVPAGYSFFRFADTAELRRLLEGAALTDIAVRDISITYVLRDADALWQTGTGSFAMIGAAIAHQDAATQELIRSALIRRASAYKTDAGLSLPVGFKIGFGRKPG